MTYCAVCGTLSLVAIRYVLAPFVVVDEPVCRACREWSARAIVGSGRRLDSPVPVCNQVIPV